MKVNCSEQRNHSQGRLRQKSAIKSQIRLHWSCRCFRGLITAVLTSFNFIMELESRTVSKSPSDPSTLRHFSRSADDAPLQRDVTRAAAELLILHPTAPPGRRRGKSQLPQTLTLTVQKVRICMTAVGLRESPSGGGGTAKWL